MQRPIGRTPWLVAAAVVVLGLILRGPLLAVAPVVGAIREDLGFTAAQAGLLTSLPVLCFALVTPAASHLITRAGPDLATTLAVLGVVLGTIVRSAGGAETVFLGTLLMGAAITVGNVVVPVLIRREVAPERARLTTGLYTCALNLGSVLGTFVTAPLAEQAGWQVALAWWAVFALGILALWLVAEGRRALRLDTGGSREAAPLGAAADRLRRRDTGTGALLSIAFIGQAFAYYGISAWLPTILEDRLAFGTTAAGSAATVFQLLGLVGSIGVPLLAWKSGGLLPVTVAMAAGWLVMPLGLMLAPEGWLAWSIVGGAAQGAGISLVFILVVEIARSGAHAQRLSAISQGVGYGFGGATAPAVLGAVQDGTGGWELPLLLVTAALLVFASLITWTVLRAAAPDPSPQEPAHTSTEGR